MNKLILLIALILLLMCEHSLSQTELVIEAVKAIEQQKIYRCCGGKCYLLKSYIEQVPVKEVSRKEIYDNYNKETIIFSNRYCPKEMVFKNNK